MRIHAGHRNFLRNRRRPAIIPYKTVPVQEISVRKRATVEPTIIKKYTNRRLYHTGEKQYITLEQLEQSIREGHRVKVVDNQTKQDITQETLLQIILSSEKPRSMFSSDLLHQIIRFQEDQFQELLRFYLGASLEHFARFKKNVTQQFGMWNQMLGSIFSGISPFHIPTEKGFTGFAETSPGGEEILSGIQERLLDYEKKIRELEARLQAQQEQSER